MAPRRQKGGEWGTMWGSSEPLPQRRAHPIPHCPSPMPERGLLSSAHTTVLTDHTEVNSAQLCAPTLEHSFLALKHCWDLWSLPRWHSLELCGEGGWGPGGVILDFPETLAPPNPHCRAPSGTAWGFPTPAPGRSSPTFSWTPPSPATPWSWEFLGFLGREFQGQGEGYVFGGVPV